MNENILNVSFKAAVTEEPQPTTQDEDCGFFNYTGRQDTSPFDEQYEELDGEDYNRLEDCRKHIRESLDYSESEDHLYNIRQRNRIREILDIITPLCGELENITADYYDD